MSSASDSNLTSLICGLLCSSLAHLHWLELLAVVGTQLWDWKTAWLQISKEMLSGSPHSVWSVYYVEACSFFTIVVKVFVMNGCLIYQMLFYLCWGNHVIFTLLSVNMLYYVYWFVDAELLLDPRDKFLLDRMNDPVLLDLIGWCSVEIFCIHVHQRHCSLIF